ncbi:MAG TPA: tail fiber protein [Allosphingosinicella sp.]|nr:tail fiber protein [Allosphingosinicella sp.]
MSNPYIGEIRMFGGSFAPAGWAFCDGQLMPIAENDALFTLLGTTYGGDGQETFGIPDLRGRVPIHQGTASSGTTYVLGENGGVESVTLSTQQMPTHNHPALAASTGQVASPAGAVLATAASSQAGMKIYSTAAPTTALNANSISASGGSQPHDNIQQTLCVSFIISLFGIFPTQT